MYACLPMLPTLAGSLVPDGRRGLRPTAMWQILHVGSTATAAALAAVCRQGGLLVEAQRIASISLYCA